MIIKKFNESSVDDILKRNLDNASIEGYGRLEYSYNTRGVGNIKLVFSDETMKIINWGIEKLLTENSYHNSLLFIEEKSTSITMPYEVIGDTNLISIEVPVFESSIFVTKMRTLKVDDSLVDKLQKLLESFFIWVGMIKMLYNHQQLNSEIITEIFSDLFDDNECGIYTSNGLGATHEVAISLGNRNSEIIDTSIFSNIENSINHLKDQFDVRVTIDIKTPGESYYKGMSSEFYHSKAIILQILMEGSQNWMTGKFV